MFQRWFKWYHHASSSGVKYFLFIQIKTAGSAYIEKRDSRLGETQVFFIYLALC